MKRAVALLGLAWFSGCSFPDYKTDGAAAAGSGGTDSGGTGNASGSGSGGSGTATPSCDDKKRNGDETGIDCGMTACSTPCPVGQGCESDVDCDGGKCQDLICRAASCNDGLLNSGESDIDCGGEQGCARCKPPLHCNSAADCDGGACTTGQCKAPSCKDEIANGDETDQDCGGSCSTKCGVGQICQTLDDCDALACTKNKCQAAACDDEVLNQDESAKDCGGGCMPCQDGATCKVGGDCESGVCGSNKRCSAATCSDGVRNGKEPAIDCGIDCPTKCKQLDGCNTANDCQATLTCSSDRCVPQAATGKLLSPLGWIATSATRSTNSKDVYLIDGNAQNSYWISGTAQTAGLWIQIDMQKTQFVFSVELDCTDSGSCNDANPANNDLAAAINIAFADTDTDWANVTPVVSDYVATPNEVIKLPQPGVGRYARITLSQGKNRWWRVDEVVLRQ